jgi:microcompartment protein CcmK/EutM
MGTKLRGRLRFVWNTARFFSRNFIEYVGTVWLLGAAPFLAHLAAAAPQHGYAWIPNDLWLFVMVTGGSSAMEAFKDRQSNGPLRAIAGITGFVCFVGGSWAYASLETATAPVDAVLQRIVYTIIEAMLGIDVLYRAPPMMGAAIKEARRKGG